MSHRTLGSPSLLLLLCTTLGACSSDRVAPLAGRAVTVSFASAASTSATGTSAPLGAMPAASRSLSLSSSADVLVISRVQLVVARLELQRVGASCATSAAAGDDSPDEHECAELQLAPSVVDLPLGGAPAGVLSVVVPQGTYASLEARIRALRSGSDGGTGSRAFLSAHPELDGVSVVVTGTFNGREFTWTGAPQVELEQNFVPALAVDSTPVNLTVNADVTRWFRTRSGSVIDPSTATAGGPNADLVADNIRRSFEAFRDDDRDGHDDGDRGHE